MIAEFDEVMELLICPLNKRPVKIQGDKVIWADRQKGSLPPPYRCVGLKAVLVDFKNSLLQEDDVFGNCGQSPIVRHKGKIRQIVKKLLSHPFATRSSGMRARQFADMLKAISPRPRFLIIGGGTKGLGTDIFYDDSDIQVVSFDVYSSPLTHFIADTHQIPIKADSIDGVWIQYVLEHVLEPNKAVSEIYRVLRKGGLVCSETPFMQQIHEGSYDFTRFTHSGHRWLFRQFQEISSGVAMGPGCQLLWSIEHLATGLFRSRKMGKFIKLMFFWTQFIEMLMPESYRYDNASSFFFIGRKTDTSIKPDYIIDYYRGS